MIASVVDAPAPRILLIEDEVVLAMELAEQLTTYGYHVVGTARSGPQALALFVDSVVPVDLVVCDIGLPGVWDGIQTVIELTHRRAVPVIYLTGHADGDTWARAQATRPAAYLIKSCPAGTLRRALERALNQGVLRRLAAPAPSDHEPGRLSTQSPNSIPGFGLPSTPTHSDALFIRQPEHYVRVEPRDVLYLVADDAHSTLVTATHRYPVPLALPSLLAQLASARLVRIHRSYAVNLDQVAAFNEWEVNVNDQVLPLGSVYREAFLAYFPLY